jgi:hypothetical protein
MFSLLDVSRVVRRNRPFAVVEDDELLDIFHDLRLNSKCVTRSASTVSRDVKEIFKNIPC